MKIYTQTYDLAKASPHRFWVAPYSDFKIGIKLLEKGELSDKDFTLKASSVELTPDEDKVDNYTLFTIKSNDTGFVEYTIEVEGVAEKLKLMQIVTDSTVFEIDAGGGGDVPADVATQTWVNSQISDFITDDALTAYATKSYVDSAISDFVEEDELTAYATKAELTGYVENGDLTAYYTKSETSSAAEISTALAGKQPTGDYALTSQIPTVNDATITVTQGGTTKGTFTLNQSGNATIALDAGGGGGAISAYDMSESPVWSKTMVEQALVDNICLPQTIVQYHDNTVSVLNIEGTLSGTFNQFNSPVQVENANNSRPRKVIVGTNVSAVTNAAFQGFGSNSDFFEEIILPDSVVEIGDNAFNGNYKLTKFRMSNNLTSIDYGAFKDCIKIPVLELPDSVQTIGSIGFNYIIDVGNTRKTVINSTATYPSRPIGTSAKLYVPDALYDTWIATSPWSNYASQIHRRSELEAPYATSTAVSALTAANSKVTGGAETGTTGTPAAVNAVKSVYETDWATLSATADANTFYVVLPDPE